MKIQNTFALFLLLGLLSADFTADYEHLGYGSLSVSSEVTNVTQLTNITNITNIVNISNLTPGTINTIETLGVLAAICIILFLAAHLTEQRILGVFASLLLLLLGVMIVTDGIAYDVGEIQGGANTLNANSMANTSGNLTYTNTSSIEYYNVTSTNMYAPMEVPYVDFAQTVGLVLLLLSMFGLLYYGLGVGEALNKK